jgi:hypothetical protein
MSDAYVYHFTGGEDRPGENHASNRRATLESIKGNGEPIMESQVVVDHSELDGGGFVLAALVSNDSCAMRDLTAEIKSLELRAASRDREALALVDNADGERKYMLQLESRELRRQAMTLAKQVADLTTLERATATVIAGIVRA